MSDETSEQGAMTMRDQFAMYAASAMYAVRTCWEAGLVIPAGSTWQEALAKDAYSIADAMIKERENAR
jgi:hypothetical protein